MPHLVQQTAAGGPLIDVLVGVSSFRKEALEKAGQPVPPSIPMRALIDTGASCTCVDPSIITSLGITPSGSMPIHTPSTSGAPKICNQYDIQLVLVHPKLTYTIQALPVIESDLAAQGIQALLGRDVLGHCLFVYDGANGNYTLAF